MNKKEMIEKLFGYTEATYYRHKKESRKIIELVELLGEKRIIEFLTTNVIKDLNKNENFEKNLMEDYIVVQAIYKLNNKPGKYLPNAKNIWSKVFKEAIQNSKAENKKEFFKYLEKNETWFITKKWVENTKEYLDTFSDLEIQLMCKNKEIVLEKLTI